MLAAVQLSFFHNKHEEKVYFYYRANTKLRESDGRTSRSILFLLRQRFANNHKLLSMKKTHTLCFCFVFTLNIRAKLAAFELHLGQFQSSDTGVRSPSTDASNKHLVTESVAMTTVRRAFSIRGHECRSVSSRCRNEDVSQSFYCINCQN